MTNQNSDLDQLSAAELRQRLIVAQEENQKLNTIVATMVSELMTPLNVINSDGNLLLEAENDLFSPLNEKQTKAVGYMQAGAVRSKEIFQDAIKILTKPEALENLESSLVQDYRRQLHEANQQLDNLQNRKDALHDLFLNFVHDFYTPLTIILAYTKLYQEKQFLPSGSLEELVEIFDSKAKMCLASFQIFRSAYATIYASHEDFDWQIMRLNQLVDASEFEVQFEMEEYPLLRLPESFGQVFRLLWYTFNGVEPKKLPLVVKKDREQLHLTIISEIHNAMFSYDIDSETNRVSCNERPRLSSICIANEFVKKVGGTMFIKSDAKTGSTVILILPIYQQES